MSSEMSGNVRLESLPNARMEQAARLVAEDDLTDEQIATEAKITDRQLRRWKLLPEFKARVAEHVAEITHQIMHSGYCRVDKRLALLNRNVERLEAIVGAKREQVLKEREAKREDATAEALDGGSNLLDDDEEIGQYYARALGELAAQPGADQGLLIRKETPVKHGVQIEYLIATNIIAEERALLKHIAQETGEWVERISSNLSLDAALAGLLAKVEPEPESTSPGDSSDLAA